MKRFILPVAALAVLVPATARATPQPLPFSYVYETLPKGSLEVEQYVDYDPIKVLDQSGNRIGYAATQFQTEFEYGLTDHLELGLYATIAPSAPQTYADVPPLTEGTGVKERLRYRFAEEGEWPVDLGLYLELVQNEHEVEVEGKILLQRRIGDLRLVANLWAEREYENLDFKQGDWVVNPTLGATYQVTPLFHPGVESWLHAEFPDSHPTATFNLRPQVYVGPTMMFDFGNFWFSLGGYWRVTEVTHGLNDGRIGGVQADAFGPFWLRMVVGLSF